MASGRVYNRLNEFIGHVEQEGGYYNIYWGWTDHVGWVEEEGGYYPVYQAETHRCIGRVRLEGADYRVYRTWTNLAGHLRREGGQYRVYRAGAGLIGSVELEDTVQVIPLLLSGGAALLLLM